MLARIYWVFLGNLMLFGSCAWAFVEDELALADLLFWLSVMSLTGVRYLDIRRYAGTTIRGLPARANTWRRYSTLLLIVSALLWGCSLFNHF
jgi:hypothetical protein